VKQGISMGLAGLDPISWVQTDDPVLSLYTIAIARGIHEARAAAMKEAEEGR